MNWKLLVYRARCNLFLRLPSKEFCRPKNFVTLYEDKSTYLGLEIRIWEWVLLGGTGSETMPLFVFCTWVMGIDCFHDVNSSLYSCLGIESHVPSDGYTTNVLRQMGERQKADWLHTKANQCLLPCFMLFRVYKDGAKLCVFEHGSKLHISHIFIHMWTEFQNRWWWFGSVHLWS